MVVEALGGIADHRRERVQCAGRVHQRQVWAGLAGLDHRAAGFVQAAARRAQRADGVRAVDRGFDGVLARHVGAQAQRAEQVHRMQEIAHHVAVAGHHAPAHAPAAGAVHLAQAAEGDARHVACERGDRHEARAVVQHLVVDLVDHQQQAVLGRDGDDALQQLARVRRAGGIVGVDQHDGAGARADQLLDLDRIGQEIVVRIAAVIHRTAVIEDGRGRPQRVVGRRHQHFVARIQQRAQRQVDQFRHAVADEYAVRVRIRRAALGVRRGDRIARRGQALLVRVRIGAAHVVGDRALQVFRRTETERARVADVELDQLLPLGLQLPGSPRQFAPDFVADFGQAFARGERFDGRGGHGGTAEGRMNWGGPA